MNDLEAFLNGISDSFAIDDKISYGPSVVAKLCVPAADAFHTNEHACTCSYNLCDQTSTTMTFQSIQHNIFQSPLLQPGSK